MILQEWSELVTVWEAVTTFGVAVGLAVGVGVADAVGVALGSDTGLNVGCAIPLTVAVAGAKFAESVGAASGEVQAVRAKINKMFVFMDLG
jgi:hypothetical protein